LEYAPVGI